MHQTFDYRFFDQTVSVRWGDARLAAQWQARYARMALPAGSAPPTALYAIDHADNGLSIDLAGRRWQLPAAHADIELLFDTLLHAILQRVRSHFLLHAGVLARHGAGTAIVAPSGHGKTTLTLALLNAGYDLLSDETAAIGRADGVLAPFARRLAVRAGTVALLGVADRGGPRTDDGRLLLDADDVRAGAVSQPLPLTRLFVMSDPAAPPEGNAYRLLLDRLPDGWLAGAQQLPGIAALAVVGSATAPVALRAEIADGSRAFVALEAYCVASDVLLLDVQPARWHRPDFRGPVHCTPLPPSEAARKLLGHLQHGHSSALFADFNGNMLQLYLALARRLANVRCYALTPGPLPDLLAALAAAA